MNAASKTHADRHTQTDPAARTFGDAKTCPALWIRGLVGKRPPPNTISTKKRPSTSLSRCQGASKNLSRYKQAGCKPSRGHHKRRQEVSSGPSFSPSHTLGDACCTFGVPRKPPPFPVRATQEIIGTFIGGSPPRGNHATADVIERGAQLPRSWHQHGRHLGAHVGRYLGV